METNKVAKPDNTALRTALWRALHVQIDALPHIIEDEIGLKLIAPDAGWQERPDMKYTKRIRASIVARARFVDDFIIEKRQQGISQYVILGAGLDSFAQRRPDIASHLQIYEIDQPNTLIWKQQRLVEIGLNIPDNLQFVKVDFETTSWWDELLKTGFDATQPTAIVSTGVTLYLTNEAIKELLSTMNKFAAGSALAVTFYLPVEMLDEEDKSLMEMSIKGAQASGTPMISFFAPDEILNLAHDAGFSNIQTISTKDMEQLYFANRADQLLPSDGEVFLLATI